MAKTVVRRCGKECVPKIPKTGDRFAITQKKLVLSRMLTANNLLYSYLNPKNDVILQLVSAVFHTVPIALIILEYPGCRVSNRGKALTICLTLCVGDADVSHHRGFVKPLRAWV